MWGKAGGRAPPYPLRRRGKPNGVFAGDVWMFAGDVWMVAGDVGVLAWYVWVAPFLIIVFVVDIHLF